MIEIQFYFFLIGAEKIEEYESTNVFAIQWSYKEVVMEKRNTYFWERWRLKSWSGTNLIYV